MKKNFTQFKTTTLDTCLIALGLFMLSFPVSFAQEVVSSEKKMYSLGNGKMWSLEKGLEEVMKRFKVEIVYESDIIWNHNVNPNLLNKYDSHEEILQAWFTGTSLRLELLREGSYVITKKVNAPPPNEAKIPKLNEPGSLEVSPETQPQKRRGLASSQLFTQQHQVSGTVRAEGMGDGLPGVSVLLKGTSIGTITDADGKYSLEMPDGDGVLVFSFVGYNTQEIPLNGRSVIDVTLEEDVRTLNEVVVTALGIERDKDQLGYGTSKVEGSQIVSAAEGNLINGLAGKASGVRITRTSGDPGAGSHIQIRGASTIGGIQPLIILDGVPIDNSGNGGSTTGVNGQSRLNDINPDDIASVDVLKGSAAAALWGTRASNGVIMITTKKGRQQDKVSINFRSSYSFDQIIDRHDLQDKFGQGDRGVYSQTSIRSWGDRIADRSGEPDLVDDAGPFFVAEDGTIYYSIVEKRSRQTFDDQNFDKVIQNGYFFDNSLSVSGGDERSSFFISASHLDQQGIIRNNSDYARTTFRVNVTRKIKDIITFSTNNSYSRISSNRIRKGNSSSGLYIGLLRSAPDFDISDYEGEYFARPDVPPVANRQRAYRNPLGANPNPGFNNPLWTINNQPNFTKVNRFITSGKINITPNKWFEGIVRVGLDTYIDERSRLFSVGSAGAVFSTGVFEDTRIIDQEFNGDAMVIFRPEITPSLSSEILVGFNFNQRNRNSLSGQIEGFIDPSNNIRDFVNGTRGNLDLSDSETLRRNAAGYASVDLGYKDFLFATLTGRMESASTFGELSDKTFFFPSATVAWQFSKFLNLGSVLSFGKLRASYAEVGVEPDVYRTVSEFVAPSYSDPLGGGDLEVSRYGNGAFVPSDNVGNPFLSPERKKEFEVGTDLRFFAGRLSTSFTYYNNVTKDVLLEIDIPTSAGYSEITDNAAEIRNEGFEIDLTYLLVDNDDFKWSITALWDRNRNEVTNLEGSESEELGGLGGISGRAVEGYQLGVLWGSQWERDANNSLLLDENGFPNLAGTEGVIGDPNPDWRGSLLSTARYKGFSLNVVVETFQGADIAAGTFGVLQNYGRTSESANETVAPANLLTYDGQIIPEGNTFRGNIQDFGAGPVALTEAWYRGEGGYFNGAREQFIQDGSWTRLQEVTFGYTLNTANIKALSKLEKIELLLTGRNLVIWSPFEGNDPNTNLTGVDTARGIDYFNNPGTKSYILTLKITY